jgi:hypothetical protein
MIYLERDSSFHLVMSDEKPSYSKKGKSRSVAENIEQLKLGFD